MPPRPGGFRKGVDGDVRDVVGGAATSVGGHIGWYDAHRLRKGVDGQVSDVVGVAATSVGGHIGWHHAHSVPRGHRKRDPLDLRCDGG